MEEKDREFQIFVKPVGRRCNLRCKYCYYLETRSHFQDGKPGIMNEKVLERYIAQHLEASSAQTVFFSWHGGEPLIAGIDFFKKVVQLQEKYRHSGRHIINGVQTNGTLIDNNWASFLSENRFMVGISIDGPGDLHNRYRITADKKSSLASTLRGYGLLMKYNVICEILCVVHSLNVRFPMVVYSFFRELGAKYITFLPLVQISTDTKQGVTRATVPSAEFGRFLISVFDEWVGRDIGEIKIQIFEEAARSAFRQDHTLCIFKEECGNVPVIEHNGDFYTCDHYVNPENLVGNIMNDSIAAFLDSEKQMSFGKAKSSTLPRYCLKCEVKEMCNGECPKNRFIKTPDGEPGLNYLCKGYKMFFTHCRPFVEAIGSVWGSQK